MTGIVGCDRPESSSHRSINELDKVAELVQVGNHQVTVLDFALLRDEVILPLSYLTEELRIVRLDNRDEALVAETGVKIGNQHILVSGTLTNRLPFRLFNKYGEFITNIGGFGQGPGEWSSSVPAWQLDEKNNRIYLMPGFQNRILVYDLSGRFLDFIPMPFRLTNMYSFYVDMENGLVTVFAPPVADDRFMPTYCAWVQNFSGEIIHGISADFIEIDLNCDSPKPIGVFSNRNNANVLDVHFFNVVTPRNDNDTLYHYDIKRNELIPRFSINFGSRRIPLHVLSELPHHYIGYFFELTPCDQFRGLYYRASPRSVIVDKETLRGGYFRLINDFLGNIEIRYPVFALTNGYFTANLEPGTLLDKLEDALLNNEMSDEMRKNLVDIKNSIDINSNNYLLYARLRQ